jgi:hypothetical protein
MTSVSKQIAKQVLDKINEIDEEEEGVSQICITINTNCIEAQVEETLGNEGAVIMGIHTIFILEVPVTIERLNLEYTLLCVLADISTKTLLKNPGLTKEERLRTNNSLISAVSMEAYKKYQCLMLGYQMFYDLQKRSFKTCEMVVQNENFGVVKLPSDRDKDILAQNTKWTSDLLASLNIKLLNLGTSTTYLDTRQARITNKIYVEQVDS